MSESSDDFPARDVTLEVTRYSPGYGVVSAWRDGAVLRVEIGDTPEVTAVISGNAAGLTSLARHLLTLAQADVPVGSHMDFDSYCGWLEEGSAAVRIEIER